ncbi:NDR1/HIN1-like protein 13 [Apium graveolens]|uniref:NDR1/HIN1-like protein 13 n=1 Tax=Apium graveolens TaxID=4045 RepID=UPI003D78CECA
MSSRNAAATTTTIPGGATQPPPFTTRRQRTNQIANNICTFVRDCLIAAIIALIIIALISILSSLIIRPRTPRFTVLSATGVAAVNETSSEFKAACNLSVLAYNPNGNLVIWYKKLDVLILYGSDYELSETRLAPMFQRKRNQTVLSARFVSDDVDVDKNVIEGLASELRRGVVTFRVRILALVRFKRGKWLTKSYLVKADCNGVDIRFSNATGVGNLIEPSRQCEGVCKTGLWNAAPKLAVLATLLLAYY